jgi:hexosaminidase
MIADGQLQANTSLPGLAIEYSLDQGKTWQAFSAPVAVGTADGKTKALLRSRLGKHASRTTAVF